MGMLLILCLAVLFAATTQLRPTPRRAKIRIRSDERRDR